MLVRWIGVGLTALAYGLLLVLLRGEPSVASDQGVFLSVAARMLDGDHLYSEVVDNKDPLFFYTYAAALAGPVVGADRFFWTRSGSGSPLSRWRCSFASSVPLGWRLSPAFSRTRSR